MKLAKMMIENHKASNDMEACMAKLGTMRWDESDAKYRRCCFSVKVQILGRFGYNFNHKLVSYGLRMPERSQIPKVFGDVEYLQSLEEEGDRDILPQQQPSRIVACCRESLPIYFQCILVDIRVTIL
ncbi:hypothetical protein E3N88_18391 [Mikania micrantha]|uniref:Uncharacterized protein n=1 Tax=Mikania micrantha TaxID=192012 RepID=A0A5N6NMQ5_9ASTR|nr:hypothetical protein E3N88_18391 [Mikania micrantha]